MARWTQHEQSGVTSGSVFDAASTTQANPLGARVAFSDGRVFRYASTDSDISAGDMVVSTVNVQEIAANEFGVDASTAPSAGGGGSIGDTIIEVGILSGTHAITADEYAGGYLIIKDSTGEGYTYVVEGNTANAAAAGCTVTIKDGLVVALSNTSEGVLVANPYADVATHTAADYGGTPTEICVGKAVRASTAGTDTNTQYLWVQTWGMAGLQAGVATMIQGGPVQLAEDDNGSAQIPVATENQIQTVGVCYAGSTDAATTVIADTEWGPVYLQICP